MNLNNPKLEERIVFCFLFLSTLIIVAPVILVIGIIVSRGLSVLSLEFLTAMPRMGMRAGGIFPAIIGTFYLVVGTLVFALPVGIFSAIYLSEYSKRNLLTRIIELAIVNLAGVPSVVYGLFGFGFFVVFLKFGASILAGSLTLAVMVLPVIITASREALQSVPKSFREVSYSLGATRWQTIRHAVLPHALPGILTGTILSLSRAAGETAPILFTAAAFYLPRLPKSIFDQVMALPYHLYVLSTQVPNVRLELQYGTALVLVGLIVITNLFGVVIRGYFRVRKQW
ncbi:MAG: phosphate ABC transporter permease PstA [Candidatus Omnitrophica bacterium]|nr:phosphate ABC transporter permease PstA [Candidatus Omnitrophota bacterium]